MTESHDDAIAAARDQLGAKLTELRRREARVRSVVSPLQYLASPWLGIGLAVFVGYRIGRPRLAPVAAAGGPEPIVGAIVRASAIAIVSVVVRHMAEQAMAPRV